MSKSRCLGVYRSHESEHKRDEAVFQHSCAGCFLLVAYCTAFSAAQFSWRHSCSVPSHSQKAVNAVHSLMLNMILFNVIFFFLF